MDKRGFCIWFVGLPGCGKSSISKRVFKELLKKEKDVVLLEMDRLRRKYFPEPKYTDEERDRAYELFVEDAYKEFIKGKFVIMDGTAYKLSMRKRAREKMGNRFAEVYVRCSVETAMKRESQRENGLVMADLYKKALERKRTGKDYPGLGEVIGVDVEFEEDKNAELIIENDELTLDQAVSKVLEFIDSLSRASECLCQR
jgi:adenylylsulfate kinase